MTYYLYSSRTSPPTHTHNQPHPPLALCLPPGPTATTVAVLTFSWAFSGMNRPVLVFCRRDHVILGRLYRRDGNELTTSGASLSTRMRSKSGLKLLRDLAWWRHVISLTGDKLDLPWWNASELLGVARSCSEFLVQYVPRGLCACAYDCISRSVPTCYRRTTCSEICRKAPVC